MIFFAVTEISDKSALFAAMFSRRRLSKALRPSPSFLGAMMECVDKEQLTIWWKR